MQSGGDDAANSEFYNSDSSIVAAAHELKAPLVVIRQLALMLHETSMDISKRQELSSQIKLTSERSLRLVEALTRSTRLEEVEFQPEPVQIARLCEDVAHELSPLCKAMHKEIELRLPSQPVLAYANYDLLRSVAIGLCDNALSYGETDTKIILSASNRKSYNALRLSVRDNGPRLEKNALRKLRSRLGKTPQPLNRNPAASGLGLYIAGQFAEAMDSQLGMVAHKTSGTTFYIETPLVEQLSFLPS